MWMHGMNWWDTIVLCNLLSKIYLKINLKKLGLYSCLAYTHRRNTIWTLLSALALRNWTYSGITAHLNSAVCTATQMLNLFCNHSLFELCCLHCHSDTEPILEPQPIWTLLSAWINSMMVNTLCQGLMSTAGLVCNHWHHSYLVSIYVDSYLDWGDHAKLEFDGVRMGRDSFFYGWLIRVVAIVTGDGIDMACDMLLGWHVSCLIRHHDQTQRQLRKCYVRTFLIISIYHFWKDYTLKDIDLIIC